MTNALWTEPKERPNRNWTRLQTEHDALEIYVYEMINNSEMEWQWHMALNCSSGSVGGWQNNSPFQNLEMACRLLDCKTLDEAKQMALAKVGFAIKWLADMFSKASGEASLASLQYPARINLDRMEEERYIWSEEERSSWESICARIFAMRDEKMYPAAIYFMHERMRLEESKTNQ